MNLISWYKYKYPPNVPLNVYLIQELRYRQNLFTSSPGIFPNKNLQEDILSLLKGNIQDPKSPTMREYQKGLLQSPTNFDWFSNPLKIIHPFFDIKVAKFLFYYKLFE